MIKRTKFLIISLSLLFVSCTTIQPPHEPVEIRPVKIKPYRIEPTPPLIIPLPVAVVPPPIAPVIAQLPTHLLSLRNKPAVPGGIAWIPILKQNNFPPVVTYKNKRVVVLRNRQQWVALVGISLAAKIGRHTIVNQTTKQQYSFIVTNKKYKVQRLTIKNKRKVTPTPSDIQRIIREKNSMRSALASAWRPTITSPLPLTLPIRGRLSSPFGTKRYLNGKRRNSHTGLDIAAPLGTPIGSAGSGKIVNIGDYFFTGKTVIIDHGQGVVTLYGHMNTIKVFLGQIIQTGEIIGTVGKTGRATGPHLHWSVSLNQNMIDPTLIMK